EQFVNEGENWLPPDNFQQHPDPVIAHRTSPTNIGLSLLSNLTAYDFGYIVMEEMLLRCDNTFKTLHKMERYKGHFYNWYNTRSLSILSPAYVSTVDSGNLVGHLLILRQGILASKSNPVFNAQSYEGIRTAIGIIQDLMKDKKDENLEGIESLLISADREKSSSLSIIKRTLDDLIALSDKISGYDDNTETGKWMLKLKNQIESTREDLYKQIPWLSLLPIPESFPGLSQLDYNHSLLSLIEINGELSQQIDQYTKETS